MGRIVEVCKECQQIIGVRIVADAPSGMEYVLCPKCSRQKSATERVLGIQPDEPLGDGEQADSKPASSDDQAPTTGRRKPSKRGK